MGEFINLKPFSQLNLDDPFFDSLKADYPGFVVWFKKKSMGGEKAYVFEDKRLQAFLYLKIEEEEINDITPPLKAKTRVKIGTMKINPHGTRLGERFIKKAFDYALSKNITELYVTVFPWHTALIELFKKYGFKECAKKKTGDKEESVFLKNITDLDNDVLLDYPLVNCRGSEKYLLGIYPDYHTKLFPDSKLKNESYDMIEDVSHTNSIHKIYICKMPGVQELRRGDVVVIYRTSDKKGPAYYRSVATSICVVEDIKEIHQFATFKEYLRYCEPYSVFDAKQLEDWYRRKHYKYIIKMTYNIALRKRITNQRLRTEVGLDGGYWGFMKLTNEQFYKITELGEIDESIAFNST